MSRIPTLWLRGGPAPRGREAPLVRSSLPASLSRAPRGGSRGRVPPGACSSPSSPVPRGAWQVRWGPCPRPRVPAPAADSGCGRLVAAGQDTQPPPGAREALGRRGGARDTERVESGARELRRRISWAQIPGATMAFGKSHRDPYATSVGHLIGKEVRGKTAAQALGVGVPFPLDSSLHGQRRTLLVKFEAVLPLPLRLSQGTRIPTSAPLRHFFMTDSY